MVRSLRWGSECITRLYTIGHGKKTRRLFGSTADIIDHEVRVAERKPLASLAGVGEFQAVLAKEYAKALKQHSDLTLLLLATPGWPPAKRGELAEFLFEALRLKVTIFLVSEACFAFFLPETKSESAGWLVMDMLTVLHQHYRESLFTMRWLEYPQAIHSLEEFESEVFKTWNLNTASRS